jgi:hypothetical protein
LERFGCPAVSLPEAFEDGLALLRGAEQRRLEGIVSKRNDRSDEVNSAVLLSGKLHLPVEASSLVIGFSWASRLYPCLTACRVPQALLGGTPFEAIVRTFRVRLPAAGGSAPSLI